MQEKEWLWNAIKHPHGNQQQLLTDTKCQDHTLFVITTMVNFIVVIANIYDQRRPGFCSISGKTNWSHILRGMIHPPEQLQSHKYRLITIRTFWRHQQICTVYVIDTERVFLPKCPLTTVRSRFSADELQIVRGRHNIIHL